MQEIIFDGLRGLDEQVRVTIRPNQGTPHVFFQNTSPRDLTDLCLDRPVEELPRILTILSPAHHLASALALDNLCGVEAPPMAGHMREALRQSLIFGDHLKKFYFFVSSGSNPFLPLTLGDAPSSPHILDEIMGHVALAQEAVAILGGRADHPLSSLAGGVSRYLPKEENFDRLNQIAKSCLDFARRLGTFLHQEIQDQERLWSDLREIVLPPLSFLSLGESSEKILLKGGPHHTENAFPADKLFDQIALHREPWSYEPFAYLRNASGGEKLNESIGLRDLSYDQSFFVGPLARINGQKDLTPLAEEERQWLIQDSGPLPRFDLAAAYWSMFLEVLGVAERMAELFQKEKLLGPETRTIPTAMGREGRAVLEAPRGLIYHHYRVDEKGLVKTIEILDPVTENNLLHSLLIRKAAEIALIRNYTPSEMKQMLELVLLPF